MSNLECLERFNFQKQELILLSGDISMGKSSFLRTRILEKMKNEESIKFFTNEDSYQTVFDKIVAIESEVEFSKKTLSEIEKEREQEAIKKIQPFLEKTHISNNTEYQYVIKELESFSNGFVAIDGVKSLCSEGKKQDIDELWLMASELKKLAIDNSLEIWVTIPLSREITKVASHRPLMPMILDAGTFQNIADKVVFIFRRELYDPVDMPEQAEFMVNKNRNGSAGSEILCFRKELMSFEDYEPLSSLFEKRSQQALCGFDQAVCDTQ